MTTAVATRNPKKYTAPVDFNELYREYNDFVVATLVKLGIEQQDALDSAHNLIIRFVEKGGLSWYDEKKLWTIGLVGTKKVTLKPGEPIPEGFVKTGERTAAFMGMFKTWIGLSALGERDKIQNRRRRETLGGTMTDNGELDGPHLPVRELDQVKAGALEKGLHLADAVSLRSSVESATVELERKPELFKLFIEIEKMMEEDGKLDRKVLAQRVGTSLPELARRIVKLREFLSARSLSPKEVAA